MRQYGRHAQKRKAGDETESDDESRKRPRPAPTPPVSPTKAPRDLSQIFELAAPASPSRSPSRVAKRMLGRSRTESSLDSAAGSPSAGSPRRTPSLPNAVLSSPDAAHVPPMPMTRRTSSTTTTKRTYAGKSRSFLAALPVDGPHESYSVLRERWGIDVSENDPFSSPVHSNESTPTSSPVKKNRPKLNPLKSQTELKNKGETRRFLDEVGYLLEGMDSNAGPGLRRTSALDIVNQLCDSEFARKAKAADFIGQTYDAFLETGAGSGSDKLYDITFAFFAAIVSRDASSLADVARRSNQPSTSGAQVSQFAGTLFRLLDTVDPDADPLASYRADSTYHKLGIKKTELTLLRSIHSSIKDASISSSPITTSLLVTHALCAIPPAQLSAENLPALLKSLRVHLDTPHFETTGNLLRLLDSYLLGQWTAASTDFLDGARDEWLLSSLVDYSVKAELVKEGDDCLDMIFRVLINLTHGDEQCCRQVLDHASGPLFIMRSIAKADDGVTNAKAKTTNRATKGKGKGKAAVKKEEGALDAEDADGHARLLDRLCLALALFTNLVQEVDEAKDTLRELLLDPACSAIECTSRCTCPQPTSALNVLVQVYLHQLPAMSVKSEPDVDVKREPDPERDILSSADASFLLGHLAVLFGLLMDGSLDNQEVILDRLGGHRRDQLGAMLENAAELAAFYAVIGGEGGKGEGVAREVIGFLKELRMRHT